MLLLTTIPPRRDGTVVVTSRDQSKRFVFQADLSGELVAQVDDSDTAAMLLATGNFEPVNAEDFEAAAALVGSVAGGQAPAVAGDDGDDDDGEGEGEGEVVNGGLPIEANTPPARLKPRKAGR